MNDGYLFKAKTTEYKGCKDYGAWVFGCLLVNESATDVFKYRIQPIEDSQLFAPPIDPSTLCQCTNLKDKNGTLIFVLTPRENGYSVICWAVTEWAIVNPSEELIIDLDSYWSNELEVCGNKIDNSEPLEVE